jgi:HAD superfamily hydrolase (TIGR01509 family)
MDATCFNVEPAASAAWHGDAPAAASQLPRLAGPVRGTMRLRGIMPLRGIMLDTADVFYDATLWQRWLARLIGHLGLAVDYAAFFDAWQRDYLVDVNRGRRETTEALQAFLLASGLSWAQIDEIEAASRIRRQNLESHLRPLPGVVSTIAALASSNVALLAWADIPQPAAQLAARFERLGLAHRFHSILTSFDVERAQPEPQCYRAALDALQLAEREVLYVGHDARHLAGARAAGLRTVAFQGGAKADFYLPRFVDLLDMVKTLAVESGVKGNGR